MGTVKERAKNAKRNRFEKLFYAVTIFIAENFKLIIIATMVFAIFGTFLVYLNVKSQCFDISRCNKAKIIIDTLNLLYLEIKPFLAAIFSAIGGYIVGTKK